MTISVKRTDMESMNEHGIKKFPSNNSSSPRGGFSATWSKCLQTAEK